MTYSKELHDRLRMLDQKNELLLRSSIAKDLLDEIDRLNGIEDAAIDQSQEVQTNWLSRLRLRHYVEMDRLSNQWVSVSEKPVIPEGRKSITVWVMWRWDTCPEDLYPGLGVILDDESKVMVEDGDFDKEVIYWQYIQPLPEVEK